MTTAATAGTAVAADSAARTMVDEGGDGGGGGGGDGVGVGGSGGGFTGWSVGRTIGRSVVRIASSGSNDEDDGDDGSGWMCQSAGLRQNERKARLTGSHGSVASPTPR